MSEGEVVSISVRALRPVPSVALRSQGAPRRHTDSKHYKS